MDVTDEQKDKSGTNKPPLLPKPCLSSISSGPTERVIPQMVITLPDDVECLESTSEFLPVLDVSAPDTSPIERHASKETKDIIVQPGLTQHELIEDGKHAGDVIQSEVETQLENVAPSAIQRPLLIESEKSLSQSQNIVEPSIPCHSESPTPPPQSLPATTMQRPLIFGGSSQQTEVFVLAPEEQFEEYDPNISFTESGIQQKESELNLNKESKTCVPDSKPKSTSFSWMPTFPKLHASGKEQKPLDAASDKKVSEIVDDQKVQGTVKDGLHNVKKFFDNFIHDASSENKDKIGLQNENMQAPEESVKKAHKDGKHGIKKLFSPSKLDPETTDKAIPIQNELKKDSENMLKEQSKDSKYNIKKMFDSFKHDSPDKKDITTKIESDLPSSKTISDSSKPDKAVPIQIEPKKDSENVLKEQSKDSKYNIKKMFDSFKHDSSDKKDITAKIEPDLPLSETTSDSSKAHKDSKSGIKKFFDSLKHEVPVDTSRTDQASKTDVVSCEKKAGATNLSTETSPSNYHDDIEQKNKESVPSPVIKSILHETITPQRDKTKPKEETIPTKQKNSEHGVKKFFHSFRHEGSGTPKVDVGKSHVTFLEHETGLKRSHSFKESILIKEPKSFEDDEIAHKESLHGAKKYFSSAKHTETNEGEKVPEKKSKQIKRSQSWKETIAEKEGFHGIRGFFDSFTHKSSSKVSSHASLSPDGQKDEHIYDTVGKPEPSTSGSHVLPDNTSKETSEKISDAKHKGEHSGVRKLFDSFRQKETPTKQKTKDEDKKERPYEKIDISSAVQGPSDAGRTLIDMKRERVAKAERSESATQNIKSQEKFEKPKSVRNLSPKASKQNKSETHISPSTIQVNEPSTSTDDKTSVFHSLSDNFMAIKDKMWHPKDKKIEPDLNQDKQSEEYDLQIAANKTDVSAGTYKPLKDDSYIKKEIVTEHNGCMTSDNQNLPKSNMLQKSSQSSAVCDTKQLQRPDLKSSSKVDPGTPDTLYDTCCMRIATLLGKKALEIVSDHTKTPPKKPPKPSAEAIAKARAEVVSKRLRELQCKNQSIGENIPVGYDGIRFADDETESSCDYKDVENFDYIMDYELLNRYKFDGKIDEFSARSTCSVSSYYTADTVTLKDEHFSDAPLETISLGSNDSYLFQQLSSTPNNSDFNSLPSSVKSKDKKETKLKPLDSTVEMNLRKKECLTSGAGSNIKSKIQTSGKKVPPPLPPKPVILPKQKDSQNKYSNSQSNKTDTVSQCINGLSLSPRLQTKFSKDKAATQKRPLLVAGLKGTQFTSLQTKSKDSQHKLTKERTFNTVLKNESLKSISTISPLHPPLKSTKSSPSQLLESQISHQATTSKKPSPRRPPPPSVTSHTEEAKLKPTTTPPVPEKPKRESRILSSVPVEKRTVSPPRPPPPVLNKVNVPPPRPPPPSIDYRTVVQHISYQNVENHAETSSGKQSEVSDQQPSCSSYQNVEKLSSETNNMLQPELSDQQSNWPYSSQTRVQKNVADTFDESSSIKPNYEKPEEESTEISCPLEYSLDQEVTIFAEDDQSSHKSDIEFTFAPKEEQVVSELTHEKSSQLSEASERFSPELSDYLSTVLRSDPVVETIPKPPPRTRRIRSRTVEIAHKEKIIEPTLRRSQSLTDVDIKKRTSNLNVPTSTEKSDLKHLYTSVNKDGKKTILNGSQSPSLGCRPLPAPPPPPRKFRSLDRKPKNKQKQTEIVSKSDEIGHISIESYSADVSIKAPERKKKGDKHRFHSLSTERKKVESELSVEDSRMPRSYSVPLRPDRRLKYADPEYDENANVAFPTVAEVHHNAVQLDECGNEILESPNTSIPIKDTVDTVKKSYPPEKISPYPRQKKEKNPKKKSHSSWYAENNPSEESWEIMNWDSTTEAEGELRDINASGKRVPRRRRSDPLAGRTERRTSTFYVDVEQVEGLSLVDKETSPVHLDCSEKSVQTSLETLSQGIISHDEENENAESSDNTDNLLSMVKTLQTELKSTLSRHKLLDEENYDSSSNVPTDSEKNYELGTKLLKTPSVLSSTSELWPETSSEESDGEICPDGAVQLSEVALTRKKKKIFYIAQEIMTSEEVFVDTLKLLNVDFKAAVESANKQRNTHVLPDDVLCQILNHLPQLQHLNENLLMELKDRIDNWNKTEKIADVIVKMGPFLKLYSWYIHDFESNLSLLEESKKKYPLFSQVVKEFEASTRCKRLALNHFMLKPIQRIPQYRLLLQEYLHQLTEESPDYQDTVTALQIVSEVANHANDSMKQGDNALKLISIQNSIMGHKEIIKPGRLFVKEGELMKLSRKGMQPRWFVLFNDLLLYLTPVQQGLYRINHELPLTGMKVAIPIQQDYQNEFSIISVTRSFTLAARSQEERQEWIVALTKAIEENASKRSTFTNIRLQQRVHGKDSEEDDGEFVLGKKAPVWIPDARVTMCQLCTSEFTVTFRRHHCRACGKVICSICSSNRIPLAYLGGNKVNRVCDECYSKLGPDASGCPENAETDSDNQQIAVKPHLRTEHRYVKKGKRNLPSVLKEVCANDQGSTISGYLQKRIGKSWKKEWFVVKDKVLYEYKASEDVAALRSVPLLGYQIESFSEAYENVVSSLLFQLTHPGQAPIIFHADSVGSTERWIAALKEASVLE